MGIPPKAPSRGHSADASFSQASLLNILTKALTFGLTNSMRAKVSCINSETLNAPALISAFCSQASLFKISTDYQSLIQQLSAL